MKGVKLIKFFNFYLPMYIDLLPGYNYSKRPTFLMGALTAPPQPLFHYSESEHITSQGAGLVMGSKIKENG